MNSNVEYKFYVEERAWEFAKERGINTVIERHFKSGRVEYIVKLNRNRYGVVEEELE